MNQTYYVLDRSQKTALKAKKNQLSLCILSAITASTMIPMQIYAEDIFNPAFLNDGLSNATISDLSRFENSTYQLPGTYRVTLQVNDHYFSTQDINFIEKPNTGDSTGLFPCLNFEMLENIGINVNQYEELLAVKNEKCIDFPSIIKESSYNFLFDQQKLILRFPQASLKHQAKGYIPPSEWENGITGLFTNYYLSGFNNTKANNNSLYISLDSGLNLGSWQFRNTSNFSYNSNSNASNQEWNNIRTSLQKEIIPIKSQIIIGDSSTRNDIFDSFNFRGINLLSSEAMYPDSQQGYAPTVRGVAQTNARVIIKQNGYIVQQLNVQPGPFIIDDLNPNSVSGNLDVTIEEDNGTVQNYTIPYSTLPIFQREGRTKYNILAGEYRSGIKNQDNPRVVQATAIHGLKHGYSIYAGTQLSKSYQSALIGVGSNLGKFGAISLDVTNAKSELADGSNHKGQSVRFLYAKSLNQSGTTFRLLGYRYSTKGFYTLSDVAYTRMSDFEIEEINDDNINNSIITGYYNLYNAKKGRFEVNLSHSLGENGSLFFSGNQQSYWGTNKTDEWFQFGYSRLWHGLNLSLTVSHTKYAELIEKDTVISGNISFPLSIFFRKSNLDRNPFRNSYITAATSHSAHNTNTSSIGINGTLLDQKNLSYSVSQGYTNSNTGNTGNIGAISLSYQGGSGTVSAGYNYNKYSNQFTYSAAGSALIHANGITFGQSLGETAILVKAPGAKNVNIENYIGVQTDRRGYALIPYATAYRENRIALDTNSFSNNLTIHNNVKSVVPIQGAIARASFKTDIGLRALATISHKEKSIPYLSKVIQTDSNIQSIADSDGLVYLTGLSPKGTLKITWGQKEDEQCSAPYDLSLMDLSKPITQFDITCN